jgi:competence protein ComFC
LKRILKYALDMLYRERNVCFVCDYRGETVKNHICYECREELRFVGGRRCSVCGVGKRQESQSRLHVCTDCEINPKHFEKGVAPLLYEGEIKKLIYDFKYHDKLYLKKLFSELIIEELIDSDMDRADLAIGVPLSLKRENRRGYNQAELISSYISGKLGIKSGEGLLIRVKETSAQKELGSAQRLKNLQNAFEVKAPEKISGKTILMVDDIYTTGATLNECAKTLLECGAKAVNIATIATAVERKREE